MKKLTLLAAILAVSSLQAATINVAAPTGTAATDIANINSAIAASGSGDTVRFATGTYNTTGTIIVLNSDHRTYDCAIIGNCTISNPNDTVFNVSSTRNTLTITKLVMAGCGINLSGPGGGSGSGTAITGLTITNNTFRSCGNLAGNFIFENFEISNATISNNTFLDGGTCYINDGSCDGAFTAIFYYRLDTVTIDSNTFTHCDRGIGQYFYQSDTTGPAFTQPGIRITNNVFTRLHTRAMELQGVFVTGEVISGNYAHKWQNAFYGSWGFSFASGFFPPYAAINTLIQNNVFDARDSVLDDLVTLHTDTTLCMEVTGVNTTVDSNQCLSLPTAETGQPNYWTGWDQGIYSGMIHGTLSNNCLGGVFIANPRQANAGQVNNWYTFGDGESATDAASIPTISGSLTFPDGNSCPNVLGSTPVITTTSFPNGVTSTSYSFTATVSGGVGPYTWAITAGSLPTGLTLGSSTGIISGTPSGTGTSSFTIRVTDHNAATNSLASSITITALAGVISDQFTTPPLNPALWTFVNPVGDGTQSVSGGHLSLTAPGAALHDPRFGNANNSVRVLQTISGNFTAIAKFDSIPSLQYQFEGIVVNQDSTHWMTLTFGSTGSSTDVNLDTSLGGTNVNLGAVSITAGASIWLSLSQSGTSWTAKYSTDGVNYATLVSFTQAFTSASIGPFSGNYNASTPASPAFTALVDYFVNGTIPDMSITMSHTGSFTQSQVGATYTITATNSGGNATSGAVTVSTSLPTGLIRTAISGTGWTCVLATLTCSRGDSLAGSSSYPAITLTVSVSANAATPLVPSSTVGGGGESNTSNDSASDSTNITPVVTTHNVIFTGLGTSSGGVFPIMTLTDTSDVVLGTYTLTASSASYTYSTATLPTSNIRLQLTNGAGLRTATITNFTVDGNATLPTAATVFSLSHSPTCPTGFLRSSIIGCTGYMEFPIVAAVQPIDTTAPTQPTSLTAIPISAGAIALTWTGSVDDVGVAGYQLFKNGVSTGVTTQVPSFVDTALVKGINYTYGVLAVDAARNASALSATATATITQTGTLYNGGINTLGVVDFSSSLSTVPFSVVSNEPTAGVAGQAIWNSAQGYAEYFLGPSGTFGVGPLVVASASWNGRNTSLGGGGSSPITICAALMCPSGTYEVSYRIWTTSTQPSSTTVLSVGFNDGTAARVESSASLDNSALNVIRGSVTVVADGINPITYYTLLSGTGSYSGRITVMRTGAGSGGSPVVSLPPNATYATNDYVYPGDIGYFNVKTYGATGNGITDDTAAIRNAMTAAMSVGYDGNRGGTVYFPSGTYLVSNSLKWQIGSVWVAYFRFEGQNKANTTIKLKDSASGFNIGSCVIPDINSTVNPCPGVIITGNESTPNPNGSGENGFNIDIWNLTVEVGRGNPSAIGIDFSGSNQASIKNVNIISDDLQGKAGISVARTPGNGSGVGPALVKNVSVTGFDYGIAANQTTTAEVSIAYEYIDLINQNIAGATVNNWSNWFRNVYSSNTVPAFVNSGSGSLTVVDATLTGHNSSASAIQNKATSGGGVAFLRNITASGYQSALSTGTGDTPVAGLTITEYAFPAGTGTSKHFSNIPNTPERFDNDFSNWYNVQTAGAACAPNSGADATACLNTAMASGKSTIYFPFGLYKINGTIHVPSSVLRIQGAKSSITTLSGGAAGFDAFSFDGNGTTPVELRNLFVNYNQIGLVYNGSAPLAIVDCPMGSVSVSNTGSGTGNIFFEDSPAAHVTLTLGASQWLYARQYDIETGNGAHSTVTGGNIWVFGQKTEGAGDELWSVTNANFEILGAFATTACGYASPCGGHTPGDKAFIFNTSNYSVSGFAAYPGGWHNIIVQNGVTKLGEGGWTSGTGVGIYGN